jgi:hypothetical protein
MNATMQMTIKLEVKGVTLELSYEEALELRHMLERVVPPVRISDSPVITLPMPYPAPIPTYPTGPTWQPVCSDSAGVITGASGTLTLGKRMGGSVNNDGSFTTWEMEN